MSLVQIDLNEDEEKIVKYYSKLFKLNKPRTIKRLIMESADRTIFEDDLL